MRHEILASYGPGIIHKSSTFQPYRFTNSFRKAAIKNRRRPWRDDNFYLISRRINETVLSGVSTKGRRAPNRATMITRGERSSCGCLQREPPHQPLNLQPPGRGVAEQRGGGIAESTSTPFRILV